MWMHRLQWPAPTAASGIAPSRHSSVAHAHRGANGQPRPTATRSGGMPGIGASDRVRSALGTDPIKPIVYGCRGRAKRSAVGASSTI